MNVLQKTGDYLEKKLRISRNLSLAFFIFGIIIFIYPFSSFNTIYKYVLTFILGIMALLFASFFFKEYLNYDKGIKGENLVTSTLQNLDNTYFLMNDIKLPNTKADIDHLVLGTNRIFVIETKNFEGEIKCSGDRWFQYKDTWKIPRGYERKSPSKQVKKNALELKKFIESKNIFSKSLKLWVEGILVFTNDNITLKLNNPTVPVLKINELNNYIKNKKSRFEFSSKELKRIGKLLLRQEGINNYSSPISS